MKTIKLNKETIANIMEDMLKRSPNNYEEYEKVVKDILEDVKTRG